MNEPMTGLGQGPGALGRDRIRLTGLSALGHHGVLEAERAEGQMFGADVTLYLDSRAAASMDALAHTVDYGVVAQEIVHVLGGEPAQLIETVAERIAAVVLTHDVIDAVEVTVHKPQAPIPVRFQDVEVCIRRDRVNMPAVLPPGSAVPAAAASAMAASAMATPGIAEAAMATPEPTPIPAEPAPLLQEPAPAPDPVVVPPEPELAPAPSVMPPSIPPASRGDIPGAHGDVPPMAEVLPSEPASPVPAPPAPPAGDLPAVLGAEAPVQDSRETDTPYPPVPLPPVTPEAGSVLPAADENAPAISVPAGEPIVGVQAPDPGLGGPAPAPGPEASVYPGEPEPAATQTSGPVPSVYTSGPVPTLGGGDRMDEVPEGFVDVVIALGANLGDAQQTLREAVTDLDRIPGLEVTEVSPLARTAAVGDPDQPDYLNAVLLARTRLSARELLHACQQVENAHGRVREEHWGPRTLDVDLIVYGTLTDVAEDLELPHPRAHERAFVLEPWHQMDPSAVLPGLGGGPVSVLAATAPDRDGIRWLALDWLTSPVDHQDASQAPVPDSAELMSQPDDPVVQPAGTAADFAADQMPGSASEGAPAANSFDGAYPPPPVAVAGQAPAFPVTPGLHEPGQADAQTPPMEAAPVPASDAPQVRPYVAAAYPSQPPAPAAEPPAIPPAPAGYDGPGRSDGFQPPSPPEGIEIPSPPTPLQSPIAAEPRTPAPEQPGPAHVPAGQPSFDAMLHPEAEPGRRVESAGEEGGRSGKKDEAAAPVFPPVFPPDRQG